MNQEYYGSDNAPFADLADATSGIELTEEMVIEAARRIYDNQESVSELDVQMYEAVLASFHNAIAEGLADAVSSGTGAVNDEFLEQLRSSNEVFSTFKVHRMQRDIASQLFTAEGKLKSRSRFVKDVLPVASHHVKAWLRTEYDTAVLRAHQAADWLQFERDKDILPNLRWMPSTSITPGEDHRVFWNTVLPIEHRFWSVHRPGDRWNCKCRLEATDDAPTAVPMVEKNDKKNNPARGLENNPAKDGHIFSNKHSYFPSSCSTCPYGTKKGNLFALVAKKKGDCYECARVKTECQKMDVGGLLKQLSTAQGAEYSKTLKSIAESNIFKMHAKDIYSALENGAPDFENLLNAAKKAVKQGNTVYILPNPQGIRTPDFIFKRKGIYRDYDLKTITGKNSVGNRLIESIGQTRRVLLNMAVDYNPRSLASEIRNYFEQNKDAQEVLIFVGNKYISINRDCLNVSSKRYIKYFMDLYR